MCRTVILPPSSGSSLSKKNTSEGPAKVWAYPQLCATSLWQLSALLRLSRTWSLTIPRGIIMSRAMTATIDSLRKRVLNGFIPVMIDPPGRAQIVCPES